jgi:hypothetical protein
MKTSVSGLIILSALLTATPAAAFSISDFFHLFSRGNGQGASVGGALRPNLPAPRGDENRGGNATSTAARDGDRGNATSTAARAKGRTQAQCIKAAEVKRNTAVRAAEVAFRNFQKSRTGAATSTEAVATRTAYKAALRAAQDTFAAERKACLKK